VSLRALHSNQRPAFQLKPRTVSRKSFSFFVFVFCLSAILVHTGCSGLTSSAAVLAPAIRIQPASQTVTTGQTVTFSVAADGSAPLLYQWRRNGTAIAGATSSSYTTPPTTTADNGSQFVVIVSDNAGSVTSNPATLAVTTADVAPSFISQPVSQTITAGQSATFSATASGTAPLNYQWSKNGTAISGATSSTYTTPAETASDNGAQFTVTVSNLAGQVTSATATLTVNAAPTAPSIATQPSSQTIVAGQSATFSATASGTAPLSYQWSKNGTAISGATSSTYTTPAETTSDNGAQFTVTVRNLAGQVTSAAATLAVNAAPTAPSIATQPSSQTIVAGQSATFAVTAAGTAPLTYQWYKNGTALSSAGSSSYTTPPTTTADNGAQFTVVISNSVGNVTSTAATLTVNTATFLLSITPTSLSFGSVNTGASSTLAVTLMNSGSSNVTISNVGISGTGFNASGVPAGTILPPTKTATLNVTFAPASTGSATGSVSISSNATNSPATITLAGTGQPAGLPGPWISGYYGAQNGVLPVSAIPWTKYTHILHFAAAPGVDSSGNGNGTVEMHYLTQTEINQIVAAAHTAGKKILVTIKDNNSHLGAYGQNTASALLATFVSNIAAFVNSNGYDGVDFDWEQQLNTAQYESLLTSMRSTLGSTKLITAAMGEWSNMPNIAAASYANLDQINIMCYDMESDSFSWHNDALFQNGDTAKMTCDWRVGYFTRAGVPNAKIGIGIPFYGYQFTGCTVPLVAGCAHGSYSPYRSIVTNATWWNGGANHRWDATYSADYLSVSTSNQFITYTDTTSLQAIVNWQKTQGFGGFMTFTLDYEYLPTQTGDAGYPLSSPLCQSVFGTCP